MSSGIGPLYSLPTTGDMTAPAFEAALMVEADLALPRLKAFRRTDIETTLPLALEADLLFQANMGFRVNFVCVECQPLLYGHRTHIVLLAARPSRSNCQRETFPFISSRANCHTVFFGFPSTLNIFSARLQARPG